ncbi:MAG: endo-1,4-beta-xylanase [Oscillospiraceae bacterium]|nr:endo-1,4-beta-xylanase [Oscillospiraceae bacterium]
MKLRKRLTAGLVSAVCCGSIITMMPAAPMVSAATVVSNGFEVNYDGWYATEDAATLTAEAGMGYDGTRGMVVTDRTESGDGAASAKGFYLEGGKAYNYSVKVFSETAETFRLTLRVLDEKTGAETVRELAVQQAKAGEWTTLSAKYTAPKGSCDFTLTITTDSTNDFRFDDVTVTTKEQTDTVYAATAERGLKDEFAEYFRVGNIFNSGTISNQAIKNMMIKDHNAIECENETKPDATLVQSGSTDTDIKVSLRSCAAIIDFCVQNGIAFRGHTMVWHSQTPTWFFRQGFQQGGSYVSSTVMDQRMESYIKNMFAAYQTQYPTLNLYAYDVCNEVIDDGTASQGGVRSNSDWTKVYGNNSFVEKAFTYARKYAPPTCKLFYNDYNEFADAKQNCIINTILKPLKQKGVLDGMGMQSHLNAAASNAWGDTNSYLAAMDKYLNLGIEVQVTELDIAREGNTYSEDQQAAKYKAIFQHAMEWNQTHSYEQGRVTLVQVWGPCDGHSWVDTDSQGRQNYPLLYNSSVQPKAAYNAVTSIIPQSQWGDGTQYEGGGTIAEPELDENGYWFHYTFENGTEDFTGRGGAETLTSSSAAAYAGSKSLSVSGRESAWHGATHPVSTYIIKPGETYSFSVAARYDSGAASDTFHFTLQYQGSDGEAHYDKIDTETAVKGEWVQLSNTAYTIPADATDVYIYVETDSSTIDFYIDEMIGAPEGTVIAGPGKAPTLLLGDVDCDGKLTASDLSALKRGVKKGFANSVAKINADVDQSGEIDTADAQYLQQFLLTVIDEFPVAERKVDWTQAELQFKNIALANSYKADNENNPLTTQRFGADPGWLVYKDRLYVYTTNDAFEYHNNGALKTNSYDSGTINCVSSADLVNWTDHGAIPVADRNGRTTNGAAKWAFAAWAPDACWKTINGKDQFFLYFANSGGGIGVLTADSPTGPWTDPLGHALLTGSSPNCSDVVWMFDPGVYYDPDTDEAYLFFGGGTDNRDASNPKTGRVVKLGKDMISLDGTPVTMETPYLFEDSSAIKIGDTWYYSYCTNFSVGGTKTINGVSFGGGQILCMTSTNPLGPWTGSNLKSQVLGGMCDNGGNNHHSIVYFKDKYYVLYHSRQKAIRQFRAEGLTSTDNNGNKSSDGNYRSTQINEANYNPSTGAITCTATMGGVAQLEYLDPYQKNGAETMANNGGIQVSGVGDTVVTDIEKGDWIKVKGVNFGAGAKSVTVRASSKNGAYIKVCAGGTDGTPIAYAEIPAGGSMSDITVPVIGASGVSDLTFVFSGQLEFDSWQFN